MSEKVAPGDVFDAERFAAFRGKWRRNG